MPILVISTNANCMRIWSRCNNETTILLGISMPAPANCRHLRERRIYASRSSRFTRVEFPKRYVGSSLSSIRRHTDRSPTLSSSATSRTFRNCCSARLCSGFPSLTAHPLGYRDAGGRTPLWCRACQGKAQRHEFGIHVGQFIQVAVLLAPCKELAKACSLRVSLGLCFVLGLGLRSAVLADTTSPCHSAAGVQHCRLKARVPATVAAGPTQLCVLVPAQACAEKAPRLAFARVVNLLRRPHSCRQIWRQLHTNRGRCEVSE